MRAIKFRAWDEKNKAMVSLSLLGLCSKYSNDLTVYGVENSDDNVAYARRDNVPVMQYTGLLDKNGVEIYEGDIDHMTSDEDDLDTILEIKYKGAGYYVPDLDWDYTPSLDHPQFIHEVIGNIYENPELLEASDGK